MSTTISPVAWFEIVGPDPDAIESFYGEMFGWRFADGPTGPSYRMVDTGEGIPGGVTSAAAGLPATHAILHVQVDDVAATCARVTELGGRVLVGPETMAETGLSYANLEDPDGNHFGVFCPPAA